MTSFLDFSHDYAYIVLHTDSYPFRQQQALQRSYAQHITPGM
jgi:hypothetical protein